MRSNTPRSAAQFPDAEVVQHTGGLCRGCGAWQQRRWAGPVRSYNNRADVLDEYAFLTNGTATTRTAVAAQLRMSTRALTRHVMAAHKAGDPRARRVIPL